MTKKKRGLLRNAEPAETVTRNDMPRSRPISPDVVAALAAEAFRLSLVRCDITPLEGGLESPVARVDLELASPAGRRVRRSAVIKRLSGSLRREAKLYGALGSAGVAPRVLASADVDGSTYLLLEFVKGISEWPWSEQSNTELVVRDLARVHQLEESLLHVAPWDYESEIAQSAAETVAVAEQVHRQLPDTALTRELPRLRRVSASLASARGEILREYGTSFIHGDAHPGNIIIRKKGKQASAVFLDWARTRSGSRLEDVASLLQTLRYWEPRVMQRHDSLLRQYVRRTGVASSLTTSVRDAYAIASASNVFAGALRFHLVRASESTGAMRDAAIAQARDGLRIIRRADVSLRR